MLAALCGRGCAVAVEAGVLGAGAAAFQQPGVELAASPMELLRAVSQGSERRVVMVLGQPHRQG